MTNIYTLLFLILGPREPFQRSVGALQELSNELSLSDDTPVQGHVSPSAPALSKLSPTSPDVPLQHNGVTAPGIPLPPHGEVLDAPPSYDDVIRGETVMGALQATQNVCQQNGKYYICLLYDI